MVFCTSMELNVKLKDIIFKDVKVKDIICNALKVTDNFVLKQQVLNFLC